MKLAIYLILIGLLPVQAAVYSQEASINVAVDDLPIRDALRSIEKESGMRFFMSDDMVIMDKKVSLHVQNQTFDQVMNRILNQHGLSYRIIENNLVLIVEKESLRQGITVTGTVTDQMGDPLPGVNVIVAGTIDGVVTDANGNFTISVPSAEVILQYSFMGYQTQEIVVGNQRVFAITMNESTTELDEVIVIGYGTAKRKDFTGSVGSVRMEDSPIALLPNTSALESLKGNVPGVNIGTTNAAGENPAIEVRGQRSLGADTNSPLIVLDGVVYMGSISDINPNDIANFDILKDAVSAAVYGSKSANGVIAITTKKGKIGKPVITLNASGGIQTWQNRPVVMNGAQYIESVNARNKYSDLAWLSTGEKANYDAGKETNWLDEASRTGTFQEYQAAVSGGAEKINYYLSTTYSQNKGIVIGDDFDRKSILAKINTKITSWLEAGVDGSYAQRDYSGRAAAIANALKMSPYGVNYRDDQGNIEKYPTTQSLGHPLWGVDDLTTYTNQDIRNNYRLNLYGVVSLPWIKGLTFRANYLINHEERQDAGFQFEGSYIAEGSGIERYAPEVVKNYLVSANGSVTNYKTSSWVWDNILNYSRAFGKHQIDATLVATRDLRHYESVTARGSDFKSNGNTLLGHMGLAYATVQKTEISADKRTNIGYLGRLQYSWNDRYYFTGSYRRDGASVFGTDNKWGDYYAAGLAWRISNEAFMENFTVLNDLKLKFSIGQNGNQGIGPYGTLSRIATGPTGGYRYEFSNTADLIHYGMMQSNLGNAELGWESTTAWNAGFESSWFDRRLSIDVDAYKSKTTEQLFSRAIPAMNGFKTVQASMGEIHNWGIEATLRSVNIRSNGWEWRSGFTFWLNRNKLVHLYGEDLDGDGKEDDDVGSSRFIGKSLGAIYGYEQIGIVQETDTEYMTVTGAAAGDPMYRDIDGKAGITADDRQILGYSKENFRMNLSNTVSWNNFELYVMVSGIFGGNGYYLKSNPDAYVTRTGVFSDNNIYIPYWTPENKSNVYPSAYYSRDARFLGLQQRGFVRIQDITLSYTFRRPWVQDLMLSNLRMFVSVKNAATFTGWEGGDPEEGVTLRSNDFPVASIYTVGATVSF